MATLVSAVTGRRRHCLYPLRKSAGKSLDLSACAPNCNTQIVDGGTHTRWLFLMCQTGPGAGRGRSPGKPPSRASWSKHEHKNNVTSPDFKCLVPCPAYTVAQCWMQWNTCTNILLITTHLFVIFRAGCVRIEFDVLCLVVRLVSKFASVQYHIRTKFLV